MIFEIGKYYRHNNGKEFKVLCRVESTMYGTCLIAEDYLGRFVPLEDTRNFIEITERDWLNNFLT